MAGLFMVAADGGLPGDPLAPALSGMVQCYDPDSAGLGCQSMATYHRGRDGGWTQTVTAMPDTSQPLTLEFSYTVAVRNGAVCGVLQRSQMLAAKMRYFGRDVPADRALPMLIQIADAMAGTIDHELCTRFVPVAGGFVARAQITGAKATIPDQRMIWVRADAGYRVQPRGSARTGG